MTTESEDRRARRDYWGRNSDQLTTNQPLPVRTLEEETTTVPDGQLGAGQEVTFQLHRHTWSVDDPDAS